MGVRRRVRDRLNRFLFTVRALLDVSEHVHVQGGRQTTVGGFYSFECALENFKWYEKTEQTGYHIYGGISNTSPTCVIACALLLIFKKKTVAAFRSVKSIIFCGFHFCCCCCCCWIRSWQSGAWLVNWQVLRCFFRHDDDSYDAAPDVYIRFVETLEYFWFANGQCMRIRIVSWTVININIGIG